MAVIKCKMCGGDLELIQGQTVAECEYCGSRQTVPAADNEKKLTLFARANRLRAACEFDKAAGIYESIVADFPEEAEAYWGLVLCKYGIEYVDDPGTGKKIPTCHRSSFDSVMEDGNFEQAMENADAVARRVYREEARQIEEIRKGIIAVSASEAPYDIFICYKETDENGDRTLDSVLAQDIYDALTDKGYRVFFSRITLEGILGQDYESYIFAALNSAKIMLAVGTDYEYFNAVWVKNEWSRFLKLMEKDKSKHLIPCYKGIDAYDMPREFARLQAQDLGKMGAIQDILRGVEKLLPKKESNTVVIQERMVVGNSGDNKIASLLDRGNMALEDGDWAKADSFFEDVLNNDSKNAQAYIGKTLAQERCRTIDAFARKRKEASQYVKGQTLHLEPNHAHVDEIVERFSLPGYVEQNVIRKLYEFDLSYHSDAAERKQQYKAEETYWANHKQLSRAEKFAVGAVAENLAAEKKALLAALADRVKKAEAAENAAKTDVQQRYEAHLKQADEQAEMLYNAGLARREAYYQELLCTAKRSSNIVELTDTARKFDLLSDYQDSRNLAEHCRKRAAEEQEKINAERERQRRILEQQQMAKKAADKRNAIISAVVAVLVIAAVVVITTVVIPANNYRKATEMLKTDARKAVIMFSEMGNYRDARERTMLIWDEIAVRDTISANWNHSLGIKADGTVVAAGGNEYGECDVSGWTDIIAVSAGKNHSLGLKSNGTVVAVGSNEYNQCNVSDWSDIVAIAAGYEYSIGLKSDGTVVAVGRSNAGQCNVSGWTDIIAIAASWEHSLGLRADGTVVSAGVSSRSNVSDWSDIVAIAAGREHSVGLKADGTVVAVSSLWKGTYDETKWNDIVGIGGASYDSYGIKSDGTVVSSDEEVSAWNDIVLISGGGNHVLGLKSNGTVVVVGSENKDFSNVNGWTDMKMP